MEKIAFDREWECYRTDCPSQKFPVRIPHDAMLLDKKSEASPGGVNTGWYDAKDYTYEKTFHIPQEWEKEELILELEGVYHKATVYINGVEAAYQEYGYIGFYINLEKYVKYGADNQIRVSAVNHDQPNSRWYSGTGIYRPVWLYRLPKDHIVLNSIKIKTLDYKEPRIGVQAVLKGKHENAAQPDLKIEILDQENRVVESAFLGYKTDQKGKAVINKEFLLPDAKLWDAENPVLYQCRITYGEDIQTEIFGIRLIEWDAQKGFCINGKRVILRGACVHHDNGLLGACAYDFAEYRKVRLLKDGGYNAIRSAHNPCSKAMLRACDELGVYVLDEYVDYWYIHKTKYDYAGKVTANYREDLKAIVEKDYNHPSVVMYSTGNEVAESGQKKGIAFCRKMTTYLNSLDDSRPVTCGINIFFNFLYAMGLGVYSDEKADKAIADAKKKKSVGSEFFNTIAGIVGADFMKTGATLHVCDVKTRDAFAAMNVAGYNYGIKRYRHDLKKYPQRLILGSETFCSDAYQFWEEAKANKRLIGDFVWSGMDYLGEVGIGAWEYKEYAPDFKHEIGWVAAGSGRIDITGKELGEMQYTRVAFEEKKIAMAVVPVHTADQKHSPSAWKMTNAMESWSFSGCEGKQTDVEVYARAASVALFLNKRFLDEKKPKNDCRVIFKVPYEDGELMAVAYDRNHNEIARTSLCTAGKENRLTLIPEKEKLRIDKDLCYVRMQYTDDKGIVKPLLRAKIQVHVDHGEILGIGSACPYYSMGYLGNVADTYYGEAMVIIRPVDRGKMVVHAKSPYGDAQVSVNVID